MLRIYTFLPPSTLHVYIMELSFSTGRIFPWTLPRVYQKIFDKHRTLDESRAHIAIGENYICIYKLLAVVCINNLSPKPRDHCVAPTYINSCSTNVLRWLVKTKMIITASVAFLKYMRLYFTYRITNISR